MTLRADHLTQLITYADAIIDARQSGGPDPVSRLTRSLADFAKLIELFEAHSVSFVSVTQSFNTRSSMGRLTLNVLLSFAQFERELIGERVRDKIGGGPLLFTLRERIVALVTQALSRRFMSCANTWSWAA